MGRALDRFIDIERGYCSFQMVFNKYMIKSVRKVAKSLFIKIMSALLQK